MDEEGIWAQIVYPNVLGFGGQRAMKVDPELRLVATQIYNDAMAELQAESGERLLPMALLPWWDIKLAVVEAERCAAMGMRGININSDPHTHGMPDLCGDYWYPLWELCSDRGMPVNFHIGASDASMSWYGDTPWPSQSPGTQAGDRRHDAVHLSNARVICNIIVSGMLDRYPKLKFVSVESGIGWLPFMLEALRLSDGVHPSSRPLRPDRARILPPPDLRLLLVREAGQRRLTIRKLGVDNVHVRDRLPAPDLPLSRRAGPCARRASPAWSPASPARRSRSTQRDCQHPDLGPGWRRYPRLSGLSGRIRMSRFRAVAWDIDGTLIDSERLHQRALLETSASFGVDLSDLARGSLPRRRICTTSGARSNAGSRKESG